MSKFIKLYPNSISKEICNIIIQEFLKENQKGKETYNLHSTVFESTLSGGIWDNLTKDILPVADEKIKDYFSFSDLSIFSSYVFSHMTLMQHEQFKNIPYHYDIEVDYLGKELALRNFAILIYLNNDFSGGELMFPLQKETIKPEPGLMAIFPTSFMYPHLTVPCEGNDRFVLRLNYYMKKEELEDFKGY